MGQSHPTKRNLQSEASLVSSGVTTAIPLPQPIFVRHKITPALQIGDQALDLWWMTFRPRRQHLGL